MKFNFFLNSIEFTRYIKKCIIELRLYTCITVLHHCAFAWKTMKERPFAWRVVYPRYHHSSSSLLFSPKMPEKCQAKNHDGSGQKFLLTSDSIWPAPAHGLVIIMVCKLGGTSSISAEKFVNPWKISIMSEPIIISFSSIVEFLLWYAEIS